MLLEYIQGALRHAKYEILQDNGGYYGEIEECNGDDFVKSRQGGRQSKKLQMQGARILRNEAYIEVRCSDER